MWLRVLAICSFLAFASVHGLNFQKCCPDGENVQELVDGFNCQKQSGWKAKMKNKRESDAHESKNAANIREMVAYNVLIDENSHWPECAIEFLSNSIINSSLEANVAASCVDVMNGSYNLFTCGDSSQISTDQKDIYTSDSFKNIYNLRKCCEKDFSYDISSRRCVASNETTGESFLNEKSVLFEIGIPNCQADDVLVEYRSDLHKLKLHKTALVITNPEAHRIEVLVHASYCIENVVSDLETADESKTMPQWIAKVCRSKEICSEVPCVRKCCKESLRMVIQNGSAFCEDHDKHLQVNFHHFTGQQSPETPERIEPNEFGILMPKHCDKFMLDREEEVHFISGIDGSLFLPDTEEFHSNHGYCVEYFLDKDDPDATVDGIELETFVCFDEQEIKETRRKYKIYASLLAVSAFFLAATFLVYILLPKLLNLHGKTLVSHVISLFIAYSFLSAVQFGNHNVEELFCKSVAYILLFSFLSAFSWLNVMCLDIFYTICSIRMVHGIRRTKEMKRFIYYSIYAWGFPGLMTIFTYWMDNSTVLPANWRPNIGKSACWFENSSRGHILFFLIPIGIQISVNIILFIITAQHCNHVKSEIHRMQMNDSCEQKKRRYLADKAIFLMNLKLFIVMGISWLLEILATLFDKNPTWWIISDGFNLLQGVLVFFIFVFKKSVLVEFKKKLGIRSTAFRSKTSNTNMSSLDLNYNGKMLKSNSTSTLSHPNVIKS